MFPIPQTDPIPSIAELNRDVESFLIQGSANRSRFFKDSYLPLQFIHCSDAHAVPEMWSRMAEYINHYSDFLSFALHTGDYCGGSQEFYADFYAECTPCLRPIFNCVGNHDTLQVHTDRDGSCPKTKVHSLLFNHTENWDVTFMPGEGSMTYYKDFPQSNLRLIVLDCYYDKELQKDWLRELLEEARERGLHVITASHEITHPIVKKPTSPSRPLPISSRREETAPVIPLTKSLRTSRNGAASTLCIWRGTSIRICSVTRNGTC